MTWLSLRCLCVKLWEGPIDVNLCCQLAQGAFIPNTPVPTGYELAPWLQSWYDHHMHSDVPPFGECVGQDSTLLFVLFEIIRRICMLSDLAEVGAVRNENTALWRIYQVGSLYRSVEFECSRTSIVRVPLYFVLFATALHAFPYACPTLFGMICIYPPPSYSHHQDYYLF